MISRVKAASPLRVKTKNKEDLNRVLLQEKNKKGFCHVNVEFYEEEGLLRLWNWYVSPYDCDMSMSMWDATDEKTRELFEKALLVFKR